MCAYIYIIYTTKKISWHDAAAGPEDGHTYASLERAHKELIWYTKFTKNKKKVSWLLLDEKTEVLMLSTNSLNTK